MFTADDYRVLRGFEKRESRSLRGLELGPREKMAERRLAEHIRLGLPKPEGVPDEWWEKATADMVAAMEWYKSMREVIPDLPIPHWWVE